MNNENTPPVNNINNLEQNSNTDIQQDILNTPKDPNEVQDKIDEFVQQTPKNNRIEFDNRSKLKKYTDKKVSGIRGSISGSRPVQSVKNAGRAIKGFAKEDGLKNKGKYVAKGIGNKVGDKWKKSNAHDKLTTMVKKIKRTVKFLASIAKPVGIPLAIIILLGNGFIFIYSISQAVGTSPHFYCDIEPDEGMKESALYQQYCAEKGGMSLSFEELNGHYVTQSGSGPCLAAGSLDLLIRYFTKNGINVYDGYLWDENGVTNKTVTKNGQETTLPWSCISKGSADASWAKLKQAGINWYNQHGKPGATYSSWCYLKNEEVFEEYDNQMNSEDWTYDINLGYAGDTNMNNVLSGGDVVEIEGVKATVVNETAPSGHTAQKKRLIEILNDHPSGVNLYCYKGNLAGPGDYPYHGFLVTRYDESTDCFYLVDPAMSQNSGFEVLADGSNLIGIWSTSYNLITQQGTSNYVSYTYIEEDTNN